MTVGSLTDTLKLYGAIAQYWVAHLTKKIFGVSGNQSETMGPLIKALRMLATQVESPALTAEDRSILHNSRINELVAVNRLRNRAGHPDPQRISREDVRKLRELLLSPKSGRESLLVAVVAARHPA